jgi:hypothetical protein
MTISLERLEEVLFLVPADPPTGPEEPKGALSTEEGQFLGVYPKRPNHQLPPK